MSNKQPAPHFSFARALRKSFVSVFVVFTYVAYVVHQHLISPASKVDALAAAPNLPVNQPPEVSAPPSASGVQPQGVPQAPAPQAPAPQPTPTTPATATSGNGLYKNGTFTGAAADAFYGQVRVKVVIQSGKISAVQILEYPSDRRTSQRINSIAIPYLQSEAIQAQSANVDIISGATLTSEAFMLSLQSALNGAKG